MRVSFVEHEESHTSCSNLRFTYGKEEVRMTSTMKLHNRGFRYMGRINYRPFPGTSAKQLVSGAGTNPSHMYLRAVCPLGTTDSVVT